MMLKLRLQYFCHLMRRAHLLEKTLMLGKTGRENKGVTEDKMVGWRRRLNGHESERTLGGSEGQGGLVCCCSRGHRESDTTEPLNNDNHHFLTSWLPW